MWRAVSARQYLEAVHKRVDDAEAAGAAADERAEVAIAAMAGPG